MSFFSEKTILIPFDFSDEARRAVERAIDLGDSSTKIHILHIVEPTPVTASIEPTLPVPPSFDVERAEQANVVLQDEFQSLDFAPEFACRIGEPGHEITEYAKDCEADLIMMPSHGRTGLSRFFLGSVAERVLRLADRPVLILRRPRDDADEA